MLMMGNRTQKRRANWRKGARAEWIAAWVLRFKGYRVEAQRYRTSHGEIDLIVSRAKTLVFVEVKARDTYAKGKEAISPRQRRRIEQAATLYLSTRKNQNTRIRFDAFLVMGWRWEHLCDAWRMGD